MAAKGKGGKSGYVGLAAVAIVLLLAVVAAAYNQRELANYWGLQGWNPGAVKAVVTTFVREAYSGDPAAAALLVGKAQPGWADPIMEGGKLVGSQHSGAHGPVTVHLKNVIPSPEVKQCRLRIKNRSAAWQADVEFPNGKWGAFDVERVNGALRIRSVPDALSPSQPPVQPWD